MAIGGLKRVLGLASVTFIAVGMMIGGGIFVFTGIVMKIVGPALPVAYGLAVIPVFLSMLPVAMLGSALPVTGGNYLYPSRLVSPRLAFTGAWVYALATFFGQIPLYGIACARFVGALVPGLPEVPFAIGLVTFFCVVNVLGVKLAAQIQGAMVIVLAAALVYFAGGGLADFKPERFAGLFDQGAGNLLLGVALLTFTYLGANGVIELGDEIKSPGKTIPRSFFIAFPVVLVLYLGIALAAVNAAPWQTLAGEKEPLVAACRGVLSGPGFWFFMLGGAVLALATTLNGLFLMATKSMMAIAADRLLPERLARVNPRLGTAPLLYLVIWAVSVAGILSNLSLETFASYAALGGMVVFIPVLIASLALPRRYPDQYRASAFRLGGVFRIACPLLGVALALFLSAVILSDLGSILKIGLFLAFIASGLAYYEARRRFLLRRGFDLAKVAKSDDLAKR